MQVPGPEGEGEERRRQGGGREARGAIHQNKLERHLNAAPWSQHFSDFSSPLQHSRSSPLTWGPTYSALLANHNWSSGEHVHPSIFYTAGRHGHYLTLCRTEIMHFTSKAGLRGSMPPKRHFRYEWAGEKILGVSEWLSSLCNYSWGR